jgi:(p)ppGpp synthase/HD superfamily hydrolase
MNNLTPCKRSEILDRLEYLLMTIIRESEKHFSPSQFQKILLAIRLSAQWHQGVYRLDEVTPYIVHPLEVAAILLARGVYDFKLIIATILHDAVEDEENKDKRHRYRKTILLEFHSTVREIVELVTKGRLPWEKALFFTWLLAERRIHIAWRAKLLKLADCLANAQTFDVFDRLPNLGKKAKKISGVKAEYPPIAVSLSHDLRKLVHAGRLPAEPYAHIAESLMREILEALKFHE